MEKLFALINFVVFLILSGIHFYWLLGGRWAIDVAVPKDSNGRYAFRPGMLATLMVALGLLGFGIINLVFADWLSLDVEPQYLKYIMIGITGIFLLRSIGDFKHMGITKRYHTTPFARYDTWLYTPLCLLLALSHLFLGW